MKLLIPNSRGVILLICLLLVGLSFGTASTTESPSADLPDVIQPFYQTTVSHQVIDGILTDILDGNGYPIEPQVIDEMFSGSQNDAVIVIDAPSTIIEGETITTPGLLIQDSPGAIIRDNSFEFIELDVGLSDYAVGLQNSDHTVISGNRFNPIRFRNEVGDASIIHIELSSNVTVTNNIFSEVDTRDVVDATVNFIFVNNSESIEISTNLFEENILNAQNSLTVYGTRLLGVLDARIVKNQFLSFRLQAYDYVAFTPIYMENTTTFESPKSTGSVISDNHIAIISLFAYSAVEFTGINVSTATEAFSLHIQYNRIYDISSESVEIRDGTFLVHLTGIFVHRVFFKSLQVISGNEIGREVPLVSNNTKTTHIVAYRFLELEDAYLQIPHSISTMEGYLVADVIFDKSNQTTIDWEVSINPILYWWHSETSEFDLYTEIMDDESLVFEGNYNPDLWYDIKTDTLTPGGHLTEFVLSELGVFNVVRYQARLEIIDGVAPTITGSGTTTLVQGDPSAEYTWETTDELIDNYQLFLDGALVQNNESIFQQSITVTVTLAELSAGQHTYEIIVTDTSGNPASSDVIIEVLVSDTLSPEILGQTFYEVVVGDNLNLSWLIEDYNLSSYQLFLDEVLIDEVVEIFLPLVEIIYNPSDLAIGEYNLTLFAIDWRGNSAALHVTISVIEPQILISYSVEDTVEVGDAVNITWSFAENQPDFYTLSINGSLFDNGTIDNGQYWITVFSNIANIRLNYTLFVNTSTGIANESTVWVEFVDSYQPLIRGVNDISFVEGKLGYQIQWFVIDENVELNYTLFINGQTMINNSVLDSYLITWSLNGLPSGSYNYTIFVTDSGGNIANDTVIVNVFADFSSSSETLTEDPGLPGLNISGGVIIGAAATAVFVGGAWVIVQRRR